MKILKTKTDVDNLRELRQRKAALKAQMEAEQAELRAAWQEARANLEPMKIAGDVAQSLLGIGESKGGSSGLPAPLHLATDLLIGSARTRLLVKLLAPLALNYLPQLAQKAKDFSLTETKSTAYSTLRKGIAGLRSQLRRHKNAPESPVEPDAPN
jgi:hypothetical protein